jgi:hypothetical protein
MPQIFHPAFNVLSKVSIFGSAFLLAGLGAAAAVWTRSSYVTGVGIVHTQPVPFSHQHHVNDLGIDCRYCHTSVEDSHFAGIPPTKTCMNCHSEIWVGSEMLATVRDSYVNGKPIPWQRVHNLADFCYFNHGIHVAKGVGCATCHGRVDHMPLTWQVKSLLMEWCLDCHRRPEDYVRPREQVFNMAWEPGDEKRKDWTGEAGDRPMDQATLGAILVERYQIRTPTLAPGGYNQLMSCSTCHR